MKYNYVLPKESLLDIFKEIKNLRTGLFEILKNLNFSQSEIDKLLVNLGSRLNTSSLNILMNNSNNSDIEYSDLFIEGWTPIFKYLTKNFNLPEEIITKDKDLFIEIIILIQTCIKLKLIDISKISHLNCYNSLLKELEELNKNGLTKIKNTRKKSKLVRTSPGELNSVVYLKLMELKSYMEKIVRDNLFTNLNNKEKILEVNTNLEKIKDNYYETLNKIYSYLIYNYIKAMILQNLYII
uniref:Uncharacterized protein n=1 Tax=Pleurotus ostreatus TaxID=5322 RepID=Q9XNK3_PLEOS|nr:unknown [Pleurotus ostreatus]